MTDRERGGFYASQDADVGLDDDGDYFTWTLDEARAVLDPPRLEFAARYWDIGELGDMHHNPAKNVLHSSTRSRKWQHESGATPKTSCGSLRDSARSKLLAARAKRPTPFIDRTLYTGWNAMAVTAYLETARVLRTGTRRGSSRCARSTGCSPKPGTADATLQPCDRLSRWRRARRERARHARRLRFHRACLHRCLARQRRDELLPRGREAGRCHDCALLRRNGGRVSTTQPRPQTGDSPLGALAARRKPLQDSPTPAGNPTAASALLRLEALSGRTGISRDRRRHAGLFRRNRGALRPLRRQLWPGRWSACCSIPCRW